MDDSVIPARTLRVGAIVQARMGSTRLPGKVLMPLPLPAGRSVLMHVLRRAQAAETVSQVIVATSVHAQDDAVADAAEAAGVAVFRGDEQDVLGRFYHAARQHQLDVVVRLTADNPCIDPAYLDLAVRANQRRGADYTLTTGLPLGTNLEIIRFSALATAHAEATQPEEREHVTPYLRRHPELFRLETLPLAVPQLSAELRLTLDYPGDYALLHLLFSLLSTDFSLNAVAEALQQHPWLAHINHQNQQVQL